MNFRCCPYILLLGLALLLLPYSIFGQSVKELEQKKKKTQQDIEYTNKLLRETAADSKASYSRLLLLNRKIQLRQELIRSINYEISNLDDKISENDLVISEMEKDLQKLKKDYAEMIRYAYKNKNSYDLIMFILSSEDFNQAYKRYKYLQYYADFRKKQSGVINKMKKVLERNQSDLEKKKKEKKVLLDSKQEEGVILSLEKNEQAKTLESLKTKESDLKKQLVEKQKAAVKLEDAIKKLIAEEAAKLAALNKKSGNAASDLTPELKLISDNFGNNKGRLPWPTERGQITSTYGRHDHPVLDGIIVENNGLDICTNNGDVARALFEGEVRHVLDIPGMNKAIIIRHGTYLSVYQNLIDVKVKIGDKVTAKQLLGTVQTKSSDSTTTLHIEIYDGDKTVDPALWLAPR